MKRFLGAVMLFAMLIMNGACKKNIGVAENEPQRTFDDDGRVNVAALTGEVASVLEEVYRDNRACREVYAAIKSDYYEYYDRKLQPFMGRVEYYGAKDDSIFRGKVKSIGRSR